MMCLKSYIDMCVKLCSALSVICSFFILSGCVSTEEVGRMQWELNTLKSEVRKIKQTSEGIETKLPGQAKQTDKRLNELEDAQKASAKTVSDLLINVQNLTSEFQSLTGRFEEARYFTEKSSAEVIESKNTLVSQMKEHKLALSELEKKLSQLTAEMNAAKEENTKKPEAQNKSDEDINQKTEGAVPGNDAQKLAVKDIYMNAYKAYKDGKAEEARKQFIAVLGNYQENEYSDNARFWIAESYYGEGNYEDAILAYEELFKKSSKSDKIPAAMLKQGLAFYELKDNNTGKIVLEKLIEKFPDSEQAKSAEKKLNEKKPTKPAAPKKKK